MSQYLTPEQTLEWMKKYLSPEETLSLMKEYPRIPGYCYFCDKKLKYLILSSLGNKNLKKKENNLENYCDSCDCTLGRPIPLCSNCKEEGLPSCDCNEKCLFKKELLKYIFSTEN